MALEDVPTKGPGMAYTAPPITAVLAMSTVVELEVVVHMFTQDGTSGRSL